MVQLDLSGVFVKGLSISKIPETYSEIIDKLYDNRESIIKWIREKFGVNLQTVTLRALLVLFGIIKETGLDCNECEQFYRGYYQTIKLHNGKIRKLRYIVNLLKNNLRKG